MIADHYEGDPELVINTVDCLFTSKCVEKVFYRTTCGKVLQCNNWKPFNMNALLQRCRNNYFLIPV